MSILEHTDSPKAPTASSHQMWRSTRPSERIAAIKQRLLNEPRYLDVERARYTTASLSRRRGPADGAAPGPHAPAFGAQAQSSYSAGRTHCRQSLAAAAHGHNCPRRSGGVGGIGNWTSLPHGPQDRFNTTPEAMQNAGSEIFPTGAGARWRTRSPCVCLKMCGWRSAAVLSH